MVFLLVALLTQQFSFPERQTQVQEQQAQALSSFKKNKEIPSALEQQVLVALSQYPELKDTHIRFLFTDRLQRSVMAARPVLWSLFKKREKRVYNILINPVFKLQHRADPIQHIPDSVLIGWIGHELGHIMDYEQRSTWGIAAFGISYGLSKKYVRKAERTADMFAVDRGLGLYVVATKNFILENAELPQPYKDKIAELYLSPDDIMEVVAELEEERQDRRTDILEEEEQLIKEIEDEAES